MLMLLRKKITLSKKFQISEIKDTTDVEVKIFCQSQI